MTFLDRVGASIFQALLWCFVLYFFDMLFDFAGQAMYQNVFLVAFLVSYYRRAPKGQRKTQKL